MSKAGRPVCSEAVWFIASRAVFALGSCYVTFLPPPQTVMGQGPPVYPHIVIHLIVFFKN